MKFQNKIFISISIITLFFSLLFNFNAKTAYEDGIENFDSWSTGIMCADLNYRENYKIRNYFQKTMYPGVTLEDGNVIKTPEEVIDTFYNNSRYEESEYRTYYSNITIHRYFYAFLQKHLHISNNNLIKVINIINALLLSIILSLIIQWLKDKTNLISGYVLIFLLAFTAPGLSMYGVNLYWVTYSMYLPMLISIFIVESNYFDYERKVYVIPLIASLITCIFKQLLYFEFITTIMVAMIIPYIFTCMERKYTIRKSIKILIFPFVGAIFSFIIVNIVKFIMLIKEFSSIELAKQVMLDAVIRRITGDASSLDLSVAESSNVSILEVIKIMLSKSCYSFKGIFNLSYLAIIVIFFIIGIYMIYLIKKKKILFSNRIIALMISTCVSLLAPLSWFVLAKPHTYVHNIHCVILWFIPFIPMATIFITYFTTSRFKKESV